MTSLSSIRSKFNYFDMQHEIFNMIKAFVLSKNYGKKASPTDDSIILASKHALSFISDIIMLKIELNPII